MCKHTWPIKPILSKHDPTNHNPIYSLHEYDAELSSESLEKNTPGVVE